MAIALAVGCASDVGGAHAALDEPPPYYDECYVNEDCGDEGYCEFGGTGGTECGEDGEYGGCLPRPTECPDHFAPVCGCDSSTYQNECYAAMAGVSVAHQGSCAGTSCGGPSDIQCEPGEFCQYQPDQTCGSTGDLGVCMVMPSACTPYQDPVCGCDGQTYSNACYAAHAGVSIEHDGACCSGLGCL